MESRRYSRREILSAGTVTAASFGLGAALGGRFWPSESASSAKSWEAALRLRSDAATAIAFHPFLNSHNRPGHPENPLRTDAALQGLRDFQDKNLRDDFYSVPRPLLFESDPLRLLLSAHSEKYVQRIKEKSATMDFLNSSRWAPYGGEFAFQSAVLAAALTSELAQKIFSGDVRNGFSIVRPPGHHAGRDFGGGYCLFNNVAVAAKNLGKGQRVAIVDLDVHHGNGTEEIFYRDPNVFYVSVHQDEWPYTGSLDRVGEAAGRGTNINVPLPTGADDRAWNAAVEKVVVPALQRFLPSIIFVSLGFDTFWRDSQGSMSVTSSGQAQMLLNLNKLAKQICDGKLCVVLEGGYLPDAVRAGSENVMKVLMGQTDGFVEPFVVPEFKFEDSSRVDQTLQKVLRLHKL